MAELILRIGAPVKIVGRNITLRSKAYYLGNGFIIDDFLPKYLNEPEKYISHLRDLSPYSDDIKIYPYENMDTSTFGHNTTQPRYRNSVGQPLTGNDFLISNLRDFDLMDDCHLNDFPWFENIKIIIREKLANME